jgi:cytoskeleton protein RodZ
MNQHTHGGFDHSFHNYRPKPDGKQDPAGEAGWFLQRERERRKISLRDVAQAIRVHPIHLDAIERGDLTRMPHRSEAIGMAGAYAEYLGFDPQPMMMHYAQLLPRSSAPKQAGNKTPRPLGSARIIEFPMARRLKEMASGPGGVVASVAVAVMLFGGVAWSLLPDGNTASPQIANKVQQNEQQQQQVAQSGANTAVEAIEKIDESILQDAEPIETAQAPDPAGDPIGALLAQQADESANGLSGLDKLIASSGEIEGAIDKMTTATTGEPVQQAAKKVASDGQGRIFGADNDDARLVLQATAPVWVRIEDGKGKAILTETLMAGDRFKVPNQEGLVVIARDGGLLTYEIDGEKLGSLGSPGEIIVNRKLDISELMNRGG